MRCAIVLSGGNGARLRHVVSRICGYDLPKQYVNFIGKRSMLEHTFQRAQSLIACERLFTVITRSHLNFSEVLRQIGGRPPDTVIVQPENKDTAPGVLLPLIYLYKRFPNASVALFPSDHYILEEDLFMRHVDRGFEIVESDTSRIVLLGVEPNDPDPEYGYIVPGEMINDSGFGARTAQLFVEKPAAEAAKKLISCGALWNTMVVISSAATLLSAVGAALPELYHAFAPISEAIGSTHERQIIEDVYRLLPAKNFSKDILEVLDFRHRQNLFILPVRGVSWSDWGTEARLSRALEELKKPSLEGGYRFPRERTFFDSGRRDVRRNN